MTTRSQSDWEGIVSQAGLINTSPSFSWTWARKHVAYITSNRVAAQKGTLGCRRCLRWQRRDRRFRVLDAVSETLTSLSGTRPNSAFPVTLGCRLPYRAPSTGFSVKAHYDLPLRESLLTCPFWCVHCPLTLCFKYVVFLNSHVSWSFPFFNYFILFWKSFSTATYSLTFLELVTVTIY